MGIALKDNSQRFKLAYSFMMVSLIIEGARIILSVFGIIYLNNSLSFENYSDWMDYFVYAEGLFGIGYIIIMIGTIVTFIMWFRRAYYNVHQIALSPPNHSEGWAAGAWFVPFLNWFRPVRIFREIWLETIAYLRDKTPVDLSYPDSKISFWWFLWIIGSIISNISGRMALKEESIEMLKTSYILDIISGAIFIIAAYLIMQLMKSYNTLEIELETVSFANDEDSIFYQSNTSVDEINGID